MTESLNPLDVSRFAGRMSYIESYIALDVVISGLSCEVTVGICAYNEEQNIGRLLKSILREQNLPAESEVLVVCSGCTDNTVNIVKQYSNADMRVKLIEETERLGKASAVNKIFSKASGNAILFISADCLPCKGCFTRLISMLKSPNVGLASGNPLPTNRPDSLVGKLVQMLWRMHGQVFAEFSDAGLARHATEVFCVRRGIVEAIPFETVNDDAYIAISTKKKGWLVNYDSDSLVLIRGPENFPEYFNQRRRIVWGHYQVRKLTGVPPQHLVYLLPVHPVRVLNSVLLFCTEFSQLTIMAFMLTEISVNAAALTDIFRGKSHLKWRIATSTKMLPQR